MAATVLCYSAFSKRYNYELHAAVQKELVHLFPQARVQVGSVSQNPKGQLVVTNLSLSKPDGAPKQTPIFSAQRVLLSGKLGIDDWLNKRIAVEKVELHGIQCDIYPTADQGWSVLRLAPQPKPDAKPPRVVFHSATVNLRKSASGDTAIAFHDLTGVIDHRLTEGTKVVDATFSGRSTGTIDGFQMRAHIAPLKNTWAVEGEVKKVQLSQSLHNRLPPEISVFLNQLAGLECEASATFRVTSQNGAPPKFLITGELNSGRLQDPRLPYLLQNLSSKFTCENSLLQLRDMSAESGSATIRLNTNIYGYQPNSPMTIVAQVENLALDHRLYQSLPRLRDSWDKLAVSGQVTGNVQLNFDGQHWTPKIDVRCQDVSIRPWLFPYPIEGVSGRVIYQNNQISSERVVGRAGGQPVSGSFSLSKSNDVPEGDSPWYGRLQCQAEKPVSIDEQLLTSLTPRDEPTTGGEQFVRSLRPTGTVEVKQAVFYRDSPQDNWHKKLDAYVYSASIHYDQFPYPIYNIRGHLICQDENWWLDNFEGRNDSGRILCSGNWDVKASGVPFDLIFRAYDVPVEEELKLALPQETQFVWDELQPLGTVDQVHVRLIRQAGQNRTTTTVRVLEESSSNAAKGTSLRVKPKSFPYWLSDVDCDISYSPGSVTISHASGTNRDSRIALRGICTPRRDGRWLAQVEWLPQTRLIVDRELLKALPASIRESLVKLNFRGPISVLGKSQLLFADESTREMETAWDCQLAVEDGQLGDGKYVGSMRGTIWMQGSNNGAHMDATGSLEMEALTVLGIPVTRLQGPFAILDGNLYFGSRIHDALPAAKTEGAAEMTANALTGKLVLSGRSVLGTGAFEAESRLSSADLNLLLRDLGVESTTAEAMCDAELELEGLLWNPNTYHGAGKVQLSEAKLYELPFMIRLMNAASVTADDGSAFQTANIAFQIDGEHIPLQISCDGDVLRLRGEGWTNLRKELDLNLYSYVGRRFLGNEVVSPLLKESRFATFMLIEVDGTLNNPIMTRRPFPQLEATIQQMFPEVAANPDRPAILPWRK